MPEVDPNAEDRDDWDPGQEWQDELQPERFNGWNAAGEMLWNFIGFDGSSNWPVLWIGERSRGRSFRSGGRRRSRREKPGRDRACGDV